ncbi:CDC7 protein kinase [Mucor circinelloides 1006PhL]|uniref:non-specific serine/threonine protein kinase n=1 Tax=Mucor circinelloides f. circinelloides (strain 1006PhL) TaxID=1220926 RepID=S2JPV7_MUCC1|nr:CDC7 protein kinase [Mucor circinelloides 1006PhL]
MHFAPDHSIWTARSSVCIMPYIQHDEFKPTFHKMKLVGIKYYMKSLFTALQQLHRFKILHRDVKPSNFLYNIRKRAGYLIDFRLAERQQCIFYYNIGRSRFKQSDQRVIKNDPRLTIKANRTGTRGFRAPKILMRVTHQTCAIDVWAASVILLCFLTNTYPFFLSNDEADALIELSQVYGLDKMQECARINSKFPKAKLPWTGLIEALNKEKMQTWSQKDYGDAIMLLRRTMELDPNKRITAEEALKMDFLQVD